MRGFILLTFCFGVIMINAQDQPDPQFLLKKGNMRVSGFGAPTVGFTSVGSDFAVYNGGGGAVLLNQTVYFGLYGEGLSTQHKRPDFITNTGVYSDMYTYFGHGGFWIGYIHQWEKAVHFALSTKLGWGAIVLGDLEHIDHDEGMVEDIVFVATTQVEMEMNMLKWFKINVGVGYQFVNAVDETYLDEDGNSKQFFESNDYSKPKLTLSFLFGGFAR